MFVKETDESADSRVSMARRKKNRFLAVGANTNKINGKIFIKPTNYVVFVV